MKRAYLVSEKGSPVEGVYPLEGTVTIGRGPENTVIVTDKLVSRSHAKISFQTTEWVIEDLGSANGVIFDGRRVSKAALKPGDAFLIGANLFRFVDEDATGAAFSPHHTQCDNDNRVATTFCCCFDEGGNFNRQVFLDQTPMLAPHHEQVLPFLIDYLKEANNKRDRIALINALPSLYDHTEGPRTALRMLLGEFCSPAAEINLYDRNMLILAVQLLRSYRKEEGLDIEETPEEVLLVQKGLLEHTVKVGQIAVAELEGELLVKLSTIYATVLDSLSKGKREKPLEFTTRFLFSLLREFYIMISLVGGPKANELLWAGALTTSNPESRLYHQQSSKKFFDNVLGLLRIIVRGYNRFAIDGDESQERLKTLKSRIHSLTSFAQSVKQQASILELLHLVGTRLR